MLFEFIRIRAARERAGIHFTSSPPLGGRDGSTVLADKIVLAKADWRLGSVCEEQAWGCLGLGSLRRMLAWLVGGTQ